jgi:hypothetical protein
MSGCECKTGFFALRDCGEPVVGRCGECQRAMCARHAAPDSGFTMCLDCQSRSQQNVNENHERYDDQWAHSYRHRYYTLGYTPLYTGHRSTTYYDQYDTRSFDQTQAGAADLHDDDSSAGFGDS